MAVGWTGSMVGCNSVIGLSQFTIDSTGQAPPHPDADAPDQGGTSEGGTGEADGGAPDAPAGDCVTNVECTQRATAAHAADGGADGGDGGSGTVPAVCIKTGGAHCVELLTAECASLVGPYENDNAILLGTLFTTKGATGSTNVPRQESATLAAEQINSATVGGGIPGPAGPRPIVMVSCDESSLAASAAHLVDDLHVPAIVGPNTSQDTLELSQTVTNAKGTVLMTPTAVASSIADLADHDLTWLMVPSDLQRAPLMLKQLNEMETAVKSDMTRANPAVRLAIVFRDDALGQGTRASLNSLTWNGKPLTDPTNYNGMSGNIRIEPYKPTWTDAQWTEMVARVQAFAPEIVVVAGTAEGYTKFMAPLEVQLLAANVPRPQYMLIDSNKVGDLLTGIVPATAASHAGAGKDADFRKRVRGTGVISAGTSANVFTNFSVDYMARYTKPVSNSGMGPSYDATYAIAYALAATRDLEVSGANVAKGLRRLVSGGTTFEVGPQRALKAFNTLAMGNTVNAIGTFAPLEWDQSGSPLGGTLEMWCIGAGASAGTAAYKTSGLTYDIKSQTYSGTFKACE